MPVSVVHRLVERQEGGKKDRRTSYDQGPLQPVFKIASHTSNTGRYPPCDAAGSPEEKPSAGRGRQASDHWYRGCIPGFPVVSFSDCKKMLMIFFVISGEVVGYLSSSRNEIFGTHSLRPVRDLEIDNLCPGFWVG
jgi:hypothetical protein